MSNATSADLLASQALVNFLHAEYQGIFAFLNMLSQMGFRSFNPDDLSRAKKALALTERWIAVTSNGTAILKLAARHPVSPESKQAFTMLVDLKRLLLGHAARVIKILQSSTLQSRSEELKFIIAALAHGAYAEDNYLHGMIKFAERFQMHDALAHYRAHEGNSSARLDTIHFLFELFMRPEEPTPIFYQGVREEALRLAAAFKTEIHEINFLLATFEPEFTFELAEIIPEQAHAWRGLGVSAREAGYWIAYDFDAISAHEWAQRGVGHAKEAWLWRQLGFDPDEAREWGEYGIAPAIAAEWRAQAIAPQVAAARINSGQLRPGVST